MTIDSLSPAPRAVQHLGGYPPCAVQVGSLRETIAAIVPRPWSIVAIADSISQPVYGPHRADPKWDAVVNRLEHVTPMAVFDHVARARCVGRIGRRTGRRASRVARVAARKAAKSSDDGDGEPPDPPNRISILVGEDETAIYLPGVGCLFVSDVGAALIVEAVAFTGPNVEARHAELLQLSRWIFGDVTVAPAKRCVS